MKPPATQKSIRSRLSSAWAKFKQLFLKIFPFTRYDPWWWLLITVIAILLLMIFTSPYPYWDLLKSISGGIWVSIYVTVISFFLVLVFGLIAALGRLSRISIIRGIATIYVETIRGIPLLVQLIFWYFAFPSIVRELGTTWNFPALANYKADAIPMAILGLTFCYGAYMSEIYRAGIQSISKGQMEAARSLGMTYFQAMRFVIIPQAIRVILPPIGNEFISLLKDSSLVSVVAVADMTRQTREFVADKFIPVQSYTMLALLYLVLTVFSARIVAWIERKTRIER